MRVEELRETLLRLGSPHLRIENLSETDSRILGDAFLLLYSNSASLRGEDNPTTTKQSERELLALRNRLGALRRYVGKMSKTAIDGMASAGVGGDDLGRLVQMEEAAQRALDRLRARPGRPHKQRADWITLIVASVFSQLTGIASEVSGVTSETWRISSIPFFVSAKRTSALPRIIGS